MTMHALPALSVVSASEISVEQVSGLQFFQ
jgi:hypothetical protein